jgi:ABC-type phosphate transport system substrate-binding protein
MRKRIVILGLAALALVSARPVEAQYVVIVNAASSVTTISKDDLSKVFQKKSRNLPDGTEAVPVDLDKSSAVREAFSQAVHGRGVAQIEAYWQQQIFAGKDVPPDAKATDAEVIAFVGATAGGIGYVSSGATLGSGVKQVTVQ